MNSFYFLFILYAKLIKLSHSIIPNWNIDKCGISLLDNLNSENPYYFRYVVDRKMNDIYFILRIEIDRYGNEGKNYFNFKDNSSDSGRFGIEWEDIDSIYKFNERYFICPKGRNYLNVYSKNYDEIIPELIPYEIQDWELKCNYHSYNKMLFFTFLNSDKNNNLLYFFDVNYNSKYEINTYFTIGEMR